MNAANSGKLSKPLKNDVPARRSANKFVLAVQKDWKRNKHRYLMVLPVLAFYILFHYQPMYGAIIAFKQFNPAKGILGSEWVGLKHFKDFFNSIYFWRLMKNTFVISLNSLIWGFPAPIILALLINELRSRKFARIVQTVTYLPHFISLVVICGMIREFVSDTGVITQFFTLLGMDNINMLTKPKLFMPIYVISGIWQEIGWGSIIYLAALTGIDPQLYEAATIDGAGRWKQTLFITLPSILPTIIILFILRTGKLLNVGFEKIILLYNPGIYETSDVISSYVYRMGLENFNWSFSAAVGLFNSVINLALIIFSNWLSRRTSETSLW